MKSLAFSVGNAQISPILDGEYLHSLGTVQVGSVSLRNPKTRWLPWFDSLEGGIFNRFRFEGHETRGDGVTLLLTALGSPDYPFRERRDSSGDLAFTEFNWDAPPFQSSLSVHMQPVEEAIDGRIFHGFSYSFEYEGETPIHRFLDRQTWELGGSVEGLTQVCRNWLTPPRIGLSTARAYSTVGLDNWAQTLPGNLWGRWTLLPAFDLQLGSAGVLYGHFERVSLIRSVLETGAGEDVLRVLDMHFFEQTSRIQTNAKTVLFCPDKLDEVETLNLWTRLHDAHHRAAAVQFRIPEEEPLALIMSHNQWKDVDFDSSYEHSVEVSSEFGLDYIFIDPVWQHQRSLEESLADSLSSDSSGDMIWEKYQHRNMCVTLDFSVNDAWGGEAGLKRLCARAGEKGVRVVTWMATHLSPNSKLSENEALGAGTAGIFAARESGRHPDTGYPAECWPLNLHAPIKDYVQRQLLEVADRTGMAGYLWDSFCNVGWWQLDYSSGTLAPQFEQMAGLYADLTRAGLYIEPEALVTFSAHSVCGLHAGNIYQGDLLGYSYQTGIALWFGADDPEHAGNRDNLMLQGLAPVGELFECLAHKRVPHLNFHHVPREKWHEPSIAEIKRILALYKRFRAQMTRRTVLPDFAGTLWEGESERLLWCLKPHTRTDSRWMDAETEIETTALQTGRVYLAAR